MVQGKLKGVLKCFNDVDPIIKKYSMPKKLSIAMAEGDDDCDDGNSRYHLQELLLCLLEW